MTTLLASAGYIGFQPCCGGPTVYFSADGTTAIPNLGINIYEGPGATGYDPLANGGAGGYAPLTHQCYKVFRGTAGPGQPITGTTYGNLIPVPTNTPSNYTWDSTTNYESICGDEVITCPSCTPQCYTIYSCDGTIPPINTDTDLSAYVNGSAMIQVNADFGFTCFYVVESQFCQNPVTVVVDGDVPCTCSCICYEILEDAKLSYIDCNGNEVITNTNGNWKACSLVFPVTSPQVLVTDNGLCVDGQCPGQCFELTDCNGLLDPIYTTAQSLSPYAILGQSVIIQGYSNCWRVSDIVDCDCAIDVVVLQAYSSCETCSPAPNYTLTNCADLGTMVYTSSDLSAYVGQVIERDPDCPGCWIVAEFNSPIPSDTPVTVTQAYDDCDACKATYYLLEDCYGLEPNIITSTDLSQYVDRIVKLDWCPTTCWTVSVSTSSTNAGNLGDISGAFRTCEECITTLPCVCSTVRNDNVVQYEYKYIDCYGELQGVILQPGQTSDRTCVLKWLQPEDCNCLVYTFTQDSTVTTSIKYATGELINNRPSWDATPGVTFIYYNGTQWIMNNSAEEPAYYLPPSDSHCPEGTWHPVHNIPTPQAITITTVKCKAYYTFYGDCNNGVCPPPVYIKRSVKPGYNTPACSAEKYEKISCKASQALYRNVLKLRYGISNCCPEEEEYWLVKKELIDLAALYDPRYPCVPTGCGCGCGSQGRCSSGCGCGQPSDCSCNLPRTCNS